MVTAWSRRLWPLALTLFLFPLLSVLLQPTPTASADGLLHLYRLVELDALWRQGVFWTRWLPDLAYGYGMPLFNYYAPLVYYLTTPLHLFGAPFGLALNLSLAAALWVSAVGMFLLTRELLRGIRRADDASGGASELAALAAGLAYAYAPYLVFNALGRANLAEQWALAFAPVALWRWLLLSKRPDAWNWASAAAAAAAVLLAHNATGFLFAPLLAAFAFAYWGVARGCGARWRRGAILASAGLGALGISAFFWLPALAERDLVQIARVIVTPDFDYRFHFVPAGELVALLPRADAGRMNPRWPDTLGAVQVVLALVGTAAVTWGAFKSRDRRVLPILVLGAGGLGMVALMMAVAQPIWDAVPLLAFVQLPMRLRGLAALGLSPLAGAAVFALRPRQRGIASGVMALALVLAALTLLYPRAAREVPAAPTLSDMLAYERATGALGTTSFGEYLPAWVQNPPDRSPFEDEYARGEVPDRFVLPENARVSGTLRTPTTQSVTAAAPLPWRGVYRSFYMPGWRAFANGQEIGLTPSVRTGIIEFEVTAGDVLTVTYAGTAIEHMAEAISAVSAAVVLGTLAYGARRRRNTGYSAVTRTLEGPGSRTWVALGAVAVGLIAFKALYADHGSNVFVAMFDGAHVEGAAETRRARFGELELLGTDAIPAAARPGETVRVTLYWRAPQGMTRNVSTFVHLTAPDGLVLAQKDNVHPANLPTTRWDPAAYAADEHAFEVPAGVAAGDYELRAGAYDPATNARLETETGADEVVLGRLSVR